MAENRNITWELTYKIDGKVTTPAKLMLQSKDLSWGKWVDSPPSEIKTTAGGSAKATFKACGAACSATGTEGTVVYKGDDAEGTTFTLKFDIPYSAANSGGVTGGSSYFDVEGGNVPVSGNSVTAKVTITQVKPVI